MGSSRCPPAASGCTDAYGQQGLPLIGPVALGSHLLPAAWHRDLPETEEGTGRQIHPPVTTESEAKDASRHRRLLCLGDGILVLWGVTPRWYGQCWNEPGVSSGRREARVQWAESEGGRKHGVLTVLTPFQNLAGKARQEVSSSLRMERCHSYAYLLVYWVGPKVHLSFSIHLWKNLNKAFGQPSIFFPK